MAASITILPELVANQIRAGEVVQRPESVVKELVENAVDSGATEIDVIVNGAGKSLIQVIDNGSGMSPEDASLAFEHHATSKIRSMEDLDGIRTLGFRGEALASIAAVAHVELRTRRNQDELATVVRIEGGETKETASGAGPAGTSVSVKHLFYNTPARRHFLKSDQTESKHCVEAVYRAALAYPAVAFRLTVGDETVCNAPAADLRGRVAQLFGEQFADSHISVRETTDVITIDGLIAKPTFTRRTKAEQYLFLNGRYIQSKALQHAIYSAYEHLLIKGTYPSYVLTIALDPKHIDANVHPQKLEVKFDDERMVYNVLAAVAKKGLQTFSLIPETAIGTGADRGAPLAWAQPRRVEPAAGFRVNPATGEIVRPARAPAIERGANGGFSAQPTDNALSMLFSAAPALENPAQEFYHDTLRKDVAAIGGSIWQLHKKYILAQIRTGIIIVDQHVAHERVLYEKALATLSSNLPFSQQLLFPCTMEMSPANAALVKELLPDLQGLGFAIRFFGKNTVVLDAVPQDVKTGSETWVLAELIEQARDFGAMGTPEARDYVAKTFACKAAIKAGDALSVPEMNALIDRLFATEMPYVCPHGRPIVIKIALEELDRRFGRPAAAS